MAERKDQHRGGEAHARDADTVAGDVRQPQGPGAEGTVAPELEVAVSTEPVPTRVETPKPAKQGKTDPAYRGYMGEPILVGGDGGENVVELVRRLEALGYDTAVSRGEQTPELTDDVMEAVERFRRENDVDDELTQGGRRAIIGPATWAAINRKLG